MCKWMRKIGYDVEFSIFRIQFVDFVNFVMYVVIVFRVKCKELSEVLCEVGVEGMDQWIEGFMGRFFCILVVEDVGRVFFSYLCKLVFGVVDYIVIVEMYFVLFLDRQDLCGVNDLLL